MEYHCVVKWSEENGWLIDWPTTFAKFEKGKTVYIPNIDEWVFPDQGTETGDKEKEITELLNNALNNIK
jgi:hypothetical protein